MIFNDDTGALAWSEGDARGHEDLRFHLLTSTLDEVRQHFQATFQKVNALRACGYSPEMIAPYAQALMPILLELRVRGYEVDYGGHIYKNPLIVPVPDHYPLERERQKHRLRHLPPEFFQTLYTNTLQKLRDQVKKESKSASLS